MTGVGSPRRGGAGAPQAWGRRTGLVGAGSVTAEPGEGRGERQKAGPAREAPKSREPRLQGEVRVRVAKSCRALGRRRELFEGRDSSRPPWASWAVALSAGGGERCGFAAGHHGRGESPPRVHTRPPIHSEDRQSGVNRLPMEDVRGGVPLSADARTQPCPWRSRASTCLPSSEKKSE